MMKITSMLTAALAALTLASCSKDDPGTGKGKTVDGTKTTVAIRLDQAQNTAAISKAAVTSTASDDEKAIKGGTIYAFTEQGLLESVTTFGAVASGATIDIECGVGQRRFYALVNEPASNFAPPSDISSATTTINTFEKYVYSVSSIADLTTPSTGFFLTNLERPALVALTEDGPNDVTITLGRATAKLNVAFTASENLNEQPNGYLRNVVYKLKSTAKQIYLNSIIETGIFKTPAYGVAYDADNYLISPSSETSVYTTAVDDDANCFYMTENSTTASLLRRGPLTYVVIRGTYLPTANYVDKDDQTQTPPATAETFYRKTVIDAGGKFVKFANAYCYSEIPELAATGEAYVTYTDGVCYYPFVIRGNGTDVNAPASYNIVRNYLYKAQIIRVEGPGYWSEDATDPNEGEGNIGGESDMTVTFDVLDWSTGVPQVGGL